MNRRLIGSFAVLLAVTAGCVAPPAAAPKAAQAPAAPAAEAPKAAAVVNSLGVQLPDDAAPLDQQVFRFIGLEGKHFDVARNEYEGFGYELAAEYLARRDGDNVYHPAAADSWETSADGKTWTFHLRKNAKWSDGQPVTADDWVYSLIRYEDPKMANPYAGFFYAIEGAEDFNKGTAGVEKFGVKKVDDYTFSITTKEPVPYFLDVANWHFLVPKHIVEKNGDAWANSPETAVSNGPFVIKEWNKGKNLVYGLNPNYNGPFKPKVERMEMIFVSGENVPVLQMLQAGDIDMAALGGDDLAQALASDDLKKDVYKQTAFTSAYIYFNDTKPPFNDLKVRQAISHAIDRDALVIVKQGLVEPAYGHLPTGFPCSQNDSADLKKIQNFDPELAKKLLADAGFPDGKGFPKFELWTRSGQYVREAEAIVGMLKQNLGIEMTVKDQERAFYMDNMKAHKVDIGLVQWGADFADPINFFDWWTTQERHSWKNEAFNKLVNDARGLIDQPKRCGMFNEAEKILLSDVGMVSVVFPVQGSAFKPYIGGIPVNKAGNLGVLTQVVNPSIYIKKK